VSNFDIDFPHWSENLFRPKRYKVAYGGRGSGKSFTFTDALIVRALTSRVRVLCAREFQNSISDSVHRLLSKRIEDLGLSAYFTIQRDTISSKNGSEFTFKGLRHNSESIKSTAGINICWIEEAQTISQESLDILIPTIREPDSEIWMTMNPRLEDDPVYKLFIATPHPEAYIAKVNYTENKHFPAVLEMERRLMLERDPALYKHVWEGECLTHTDAQVFKDKWEVREFTPNKVQRLVKTNVHTQQLATGELVKSQTPVYEWVDDPSWNLPLYGLDFGFSQDPTACVKVWIHDETLYIEKEAVKLGLDIDKTVDFIKQTMPEIDRAIVRADNARPESISYLKQHGLERIKAVVKGKGSVEDGIAHIRSYKRIVVHPRCKETINELLLYSYKVDARTNDISTQIVDKHNHCIDAIRYALEPFIKQKVSAFDAYK
jgi:phage terminase large subunit